MFIFQHNFLMREFLILILKTGLMQPHVSCVWSLEVFGGKGLVANGCKQERAASVHVGLSG